jgi:hypothetical protein
MANKDIAARYSYCPIIALFETNLTVESRIFGIYIPRDSFLIYLAALKSFSIRDRNKFNLQPFGNLDQKASSGV